VNLSGWGTDCPRGWGDWGEGLVQGQTSTIPVGMLVVDLYDPGEKQLIWRREATKTIDLKRDQDKNYKFKCRGHCRKAWRSDWESNCPSKNRKKTINRSNSKPMAYPLP